MDLDDAESRHVGGSRRLRVGDSVILFDGQGREADGMLIGVSSRRVTVRVPQVRLVAVASPRTLMLAVSPPKQGRQDDLVEKCTELGVRILQPIHAHRTVNEVTPERIERWRRVSIAAAKQSQQAWLPEIRRPLSPAALIGAAAAHDLRILADPSPDAVPLMSWLARHRHATGSVLALIGPEGGFTDEERAQALAGGFVPCRLTPTILRVETAAVAVAALVLCAESG